MVSLCPATDLIHHVATDIGGFQTRPSVNRGRHLPRQRHFLPDPHQRVAGRHWSFCPASQRRIIAARRASLIAALAQSAASPATFGSVLNHPPQFIQQTLLFSTKCGAAGRCSAKCGQRCCNNGTTRRRRKLDRMSRPDYFRLQSSVNHAPIPLRQFPPRAGKQRADKPCSANSETSAIAESPAGPLPRFSPAERFHIDRRDVAR